MIENIKVALLILTINSFILGFMWLLYRGLFG
jgi:hypothetical protein